MPSMRRSLSLNGLVQAFTFLAAPSFAAAAVFAGGQRAPIWALMSLVMAAGCAISLLPARGRGAVPVDRQAAGPARRLVELLENAPRMPWVRSQMRVGSIQVYELVAELRSSEHEAGAVLPAAEAVEEAVRNAMPVPLTDEVRLSQERLAELVVALRAAGA
jgi:hypothetical protein